MIVLDAAATRASLPMEDAIASMRLAFGRDREVPQRVQLGGSMFMPGRVGNQTGVKVVSLVPGNPVGLVAVFDQDGNAVGIVDAPTLTAIRTAAAAGLATDLLARPDASHLVMLGAGAMAPDQIQAVQAVRPIDRISVWSRSIARAEALAETVGGRAVHDPAEAIRAADVISSATPSTKPLFSAADLPDQIHINAVGAYTPEMIELPPELVRKAFVVVDDYEAAAAEAGDLLRADREPDLDMAGLLEAGQAAHGRWTVFKSVGIASQDIAAATQALAAGGG
ncbi:MAG: ornithine cyclodeaminase family protein [Acidimicrobiia bacterium]